MSTITQRNSGLVQRRTEASRSDRERATEDPERDREEEEGEERAGDKEARLTLMEEVLLLGLKDREGQDVKGNVTKQTQTAKKKPTHIEYLDFL